MESKGLNSVSNAYYEKQVFYEKFSEAEDTPKKIEEFLKDRIKWKKVLDAGCGSGKFLPLLESLSEKYVGIDLSENQIEEAKKKRNKESSLLQVGDLECLSFANDTFDVIVSAWVLGTIIDIKKREKAVEELKRVLKPNGVIYLIENDSHGEFEQIRGHIEDGKTRAYNEWLEQSGFGGVKEIKTYFLFENKEEAQGVFSEIYGEKVSNQIQSEKIEHQVLIFMVKLDQN